MAKPKAKTSAAAEGVDTRVLNLPLAIGQRFAAPPSYDAAARTVELVAATENPVRTPGYILGLEDEYYLEILDCSPEAVDLAEVRAGNAPLLDTHHSYTIDDRLGLVRAVKFEPGKVITVAAFGQSEKAKSAEAEFAGGTPLKTSVGFRRKQMRFERMEGETQVYRVTRWSIEEQSLCSKAADSGAGARSDGDLVSPCTIMESRMEDDDLDGAGAVIETSEQGAEGSRAAGDEAVEGSRAKAPPKRRFARLTASSAMTLVEQARSFGDAIATRAKELIEKNDKDEISPEMVRAGILSAAAEANEAGTRGISTGGRAIEMGEGEREKFITGATNAILHRAGLADIVGRAAKARGQEKIDLDPGEFRGVRNAELARLVIERAGERVSSLDRDAIVIQAIGLRADGPYQTTSDFAVLFENVMNKSLQAAYVIQPDTWRLWAGTGSVSDFRAHPRYLRGTFGRLHKVLEDGEIKNLPIPDGAKETIAAGEHGGIVGLTRQAIVNDDLSVFSQISQDLGRAAKLSVEVDAYELLTSNSGLGPVMNDGKTLFHEDHGNIASSAAYPSIASFEAMDLKMSEQKDISGNEYLDIQLHTFLGPRAMRGDALVVNDAQFDTETAGKFQKPNKVRGLFTTIAGTPRLSGTRWYGFADPALMPAIEVVFLNGEQEPRVEQKDGWRVSGVEWRVLFDYGVGGVNYRAAQTNAGGSPG